MRTVKIAIAALIATCIAALATNIVPTPLPFIFQNGTVADATQVNSDLNTIVSNVNSKAASAGANADITSLSALVNLTVSGTTTSGNFVGAGGVPAISTSGAVADLGVNSGNPTLHVDGTARVISTGNNPSYSAPFTAAGSIVTPIGAGVRSGNAISSRAVVTGGGATNTFNVSSATINSGIVTVSMTTALNSTAYEIFAMPCFSAGSVLLHPVISSRLIQQYAVTYYDGTNTPTNCSSEVDIMSVGGY